MRHKFFTSFYDKYDKIPKDWYCVALFNDAPKHLQSQNIKNFLNNRSSIFSPSKELIEKLHKNNDIINESLEEEYLKDVLNNFQKWKKVNDGYLKSNILTFLDWIEYLDDTFDNYDEDWKGIVFMTNENSFVNSFRKTFLKIMRYNKIPIYELKDEDLSTKKSSSEQQTKIKELF